jgi:hypothetical protein
MYVTPFEYRGELHRKSKVRQFAAAEVVGLYYVDYGVALLLYGRAGPDLFLVYVHCPPGPFHRLY